MIPPSPKASSIIKYGEYPVSLYTGLVDISVPVYTIDIKGIKVPVEFKYHASGIRYDDTSLEVGLGWSLIAGGAIDCTVRGMPDAPGTGNVFIKDITAIDPIGTCNHSGDISGLIDVANGSTLSPKSAFGSKDGELDVYSYSFPGYSGQFCIPYNMDFLGDRGALFIPANPLKLEPAPNNGFILKDDQGISYTFEQMESSDFGRHKTSYLTKIISADRRDTVLFNYTVYPSGSAGNGIYRHYVGMTKIIQEPVNVVNKNNYVYELPITMESGGLEQKLYFPPRLNSIVFSGGRVVFEYYNNLATSRDLRTVKIYNNVASGPLQTITLVKGQFENNRGDRLDRVDFSDSQGNAYNYRFEYNGNSVTGGSGYNAGFDYWGYYNGQGVSNSNYLPDFSVSVRHPVFGTITQSLSNLDRSANEIAMRNGILNKVVYPTGGYTEFYYEAHRANIRQACMCSHLQQRPKTEYLRKSIMMHTTALDCLRKSVLYQTLEKIQF
jgi:hypothetical protein